MAREKTLPWPRTHLVAETGELAAVQDLLGHESADTTRVYTRVAGQRLADVHRRAFGHRPRRAGRQPRGGTARPPLPACHAKSFRRLRVGRAGERTAASVAYAAVRISGLGPTVYGAPLSPTG
jgi:hypothetical protein